MLNGKVILGGAESLCGPGSLEVRTLKIFNSTLLSSSDRLRGVVFECLALAYFCVFQNIFIYQVAATLQ